ncbi:efflux pump antibiotic resistance [Fusarium longipes]|uniref:Efflux pump antibiotic resistance n=1 Tax=Fusarium longipes TaxID=694270 RepID=A0A395T8F6_9HYPO|nr:efflux pump antibiotic resistance [Fusarium longipes]
MASAPSVKSTPSKSQDDGLKIIHAGLYRTATKSMTEAYRILGYNAHHALDDVWTVPWPRLEQAAEATWPHLANLPEYTYKSADGSPVPRPPFTRDDWQSIWGKYDVATDVACTFVLELIKAYPDAKVVVVQRKFESWWPSFKSELLQTLYSMSPVQSFIAWNILRFRAPHTMRKIHAGFFGANEYSLEAIEARAREAYEEYYRKVREAVPLESGRRLEYSVGEGWEPLCEFLGKDIPDMPFPRLNDRAAHNETVKRNNRKLMGDALRIVGPVIAVIVGVSLYYWRQ